MSGNFLSCSKGVKDPLEVPEFKSDYPLVVSTSVLPINIQELISFKIDILV